MTAGFGATRMAVVGKHHCQPMFPREEDNFALVELNQRRQYSDSPSKRARDSLFCVFDEGPGLVGKDRVRNEPDYNSVEAFRIRVARPDD